MNELHSRKKELEVAVRDMAPAVYGLRQALRILTLSDEEREVLTRLYEENNLVSEQNRKELKRIRKSSKPNKPRQKREKPEQVDQVKLSYRKKVADKVQETHKISGFNRIRPTIVQYREGDSVIEEIHQTREKIFYRFYGNIAAIAEDAGQRQRESKRRIWRAKKSGGAPDDEPQVGSV